MSIRTGGGWAQRRAQNQMGIDPEHWSMGMRQRVCWILLSCLSKDKVACTIIPAKHISFLFFFSFLPTLCGMWDPSSSTRD